MGGFVGFWNTTANGKTDSDAETVWKDWRLYFPIAHKWSVGIGADPVIRTDVRTFERKSAEFVDPSGQHSIVQPFEERDVYSGGDVAMQIESGFRASRRLALGLSLRFHLYRFERSQNLAFDSSGYRNIGYSDVATYRGWSPTIGAHWQLTDRLGLGGFFTPRSTGNWENDFKKSDSDSTVVTERSGDWPGEIGVGLAYRMRGGWTAAGDFVTGMWDDGDLGILYDRASDSKPEIPLSLAAGVERHLEKRDPEAKAGVDAYRFGFFYRRQPWPRIKASSEPASPDPIADVGASIGGSLFVAKGNGRLHAALEAGMRGNDEEMQGATENFFRIHLQLEISELWFQKSRPRVPK